MNVLTRSDAAASATDQSLLRRLSAGHESAADQIYRRYADRILALARSRLPLHLHSRIDCEDVLQSVFRAFFAQARQGLYHVPDGESLWQLLAVVTVNKVRSVYNFHAASRRDARTTVSWEAGEAASTSEYDTDVMEVAVRDVLDRVPEAERSTIELRLEGYDVAEIAQLTRQSKRSVERLLQRARGRLAALMNWTDESPTQENSGG